MKSLGDNERQLGSRLFHFRRRTVLLAWLAGNRGTHPAAWAAQRSAYCFQLIADEPRFLRSQTATSSMGDDTVNSKTEPLGELKVMPRSAGKSVPEQCFLLECIIGSGRLLRPGENAASGQWRINPGGSTGTRLPSRKRSLRPSAWRRQAGPASGRDRTTVERAPARRHLCGVEASNHCGARVTALLGIIQFGFPLRHHRLIFQSRRALFPRLSTTAPEGWQRTSPHSRHSRFR
jgi:hypothetical protein